MQPGDARRGHVDRLAGSHTATIGIIDRRITPLSYYWHARAMVIRRESLRSIFDPKQPE